MHTNYERLYKALDYLLTAPVSIPLKLLEWTARVVEEQAREEMDLESKLREELLEDQMRYEAGEIGEEEFREGEASLKKRLEQITSAP